MAVLLRGKFLYLATPRTGSSATAVALKKLGARSVHGGHHVGLEDVRPYKGELIFTTIRNPYDVLVSWYVRIHRTNDFPISLAEFLRTYEHEDFTRGDPPTLFYHCHEGVEVLRWEDGLEASLNVLLKKLELEPATLLPENVTPKKKPWREYYDDETLQAVHERFGRDLDTWGYERIS